MIIDVSHFQGVINWSQTDPAIDGAYIKVTEGTSNVDAQWAMNHSGTTLHGKPAGAYHFADLGNPVSEANHFADQYLTATWQLHPVLDIETNGATANWIVQFRNQFRARTGQQNFRVYSSYSLLTGVLNPSGWIDSNTTIWVARYGSTLGWNHPQAVLWQNTSSATVPGVVGHVDDDQFLNGWTPARDTGVIPTAPSDSTSEVEMPSFNRTCQPGTNVHAELCVSGCTELYISCAYSESISIYDILFWGVTPSNEAPPAATGVGGGYAEEDHGQVNWTIDSNRPGPILVPSGSKMVTLRYTANHDFDLAAC